MIKKTIICSIVILRDTYISLFSNFILRFYSIFSSKQLTHALLLEKHKTMLQIIKMVIFKYSKMS